MESSIIKEKAMKKWLREWKLKTIEQINPNWRDLWPAITGAAPQAVIPVIPAPLVIPAQAGIQQNKDAFDLNPLDSRIRGNDDSAEALL